MNKLKTWLLTCSLLITSLPALAAELVKHDAWVPEMPPVSRVHAGFGLFHNMTNQAVVITAISSPDYDHVEMHLSKEVNGMARMIPQKSLKVEAMGDLVLQHGGYHLMLFKPKHRLKQGDVISLQFSYDDGSHQVVKLPVRKTR